MACAALRPAGAPGASPAAVAGRLRSGGRRERRGGRPGPLPRGQRHRQAGQGLGDFLFRHATVSVGVEPLIESPADGAGARAGPGRATESRRPSRSRRRRWCRSSRGRPGARGPGAVSTIAASGSRTHRSPRPRRLRAVDAAVAVGVGELIERPPHVVGALQQPAQRVGQPRGLLCVQPVVAVGVGPGLRGAERRRLLLRPRAPAAAAAREDGEQGDERASARQSRRRAAACVSPRGHGPAGN